jgi:uncharacterized Zn finger protein
MTTIPTITEGDIRNLVGEGSFQRGQKYFRDDRIFDTRRVGMTLKAKCEGSRSTPYRVEVTFKDIGIEATDCSCPIGGYCKHVVALLLTWVAELEEFIEQQDIEVILQQCDKVELISLIQQMLRRDPDLEYLLTTVGKSGAPIDSLLYRNQIETVFRSAGNEWGAASEVADELLTIEETADNFVERHDYASAIAVYNTIVAGVIDHYYEYRDQDESGELVGVISTCVDGLKQRMEAVQSKSSLREQILRTLFAIYRLDAEEGGVGFSEAAQEIMSENTIAEERHTIAGWVREAIDENKRKEPYINHRYHFYDGFAYEEEVEYTDRFTLQMLGGFLLDLEADTLDDETYLNICRETGHVADAVERLLELGRIDEAAKETDRASDFDLLGITDLFVKSGQDRVAKHIMQQRAWRSRDARLLEWLEKSSKAPHDCEDRLAKAREQFHEQPTFAGYKEVRQHATQCGLWGKMRPELYAFLKTSQLSEILTQVALDEDDTDEIIKLVQAAKSPITGDNNKRIIALAQVAEEALPEATLHFYLRYVAYLINTRNRQAYEQAGQILVRIRTLYEKLGKRENWTRYITRLRERNRALKALHSVLSGAGL